MEEMYAALTQGQWAEGTRERLWKRWLWESDCNALPLEQCCDMNQMHVLGVLCCLAEACDPPMPFFEMSIGHEMLPHTPVVHLHPETPIARLSLRQLFDQLECLQLNWGPVLSGIAMKAATDEANDDNDSCFRPPFSELLLRCLMARLGEIAHNAYTEEEGVLDDPQHATPLPSSRKEEADQQMLLISRKSLRQGICVLFSLMRVQDILARSEPAPQPSPQQTAEVIGALRQHHVEAAGDFFSQLQQIVYLAPGMRLVYRTNFAGMYNDVSQVTLWLAVARGGSRWLAMACGGSRWHALARDGILWHAMACDGILWLSVAFCGMLWLSVACYGFRWHTDAGSSDWQVVYFHYPRFSRRPHFELKKIPKAALHMLPLIVQLLPDIPIVHDDDSFVPALMSAAPRGSKPPPSLATAQWFWLVCCGAFFLVNVAENRIFSAPTLTPLVALFLKSSERSIAAAEEGGSFVRGEPCAAHAHVVLV